MFGLGMGEIVVILVVALLVLGPTQLPDAAKHIGKAIRQLRKHTRDLQDTIEKDEQIGGTVRELKSALRGDDLFREPLLPTRPGPVIPPPAEEQPVAQGQGEGEGEAAKPAEGNGTVVAAAPANPLGDAPAADDTERKQTTPVRDATRDG
jgi:sec-independent protein translocase protein TatB